MTLPVDGRDPVALAQALIRCRSITPDEGGALALLGGVLATAGFAVARPAFAEPGMPEIANLYAVIGSGGPVLAFAGHTDVVPPGEAAAWRHDPFSAAIEGDALYGRGAVDMKGGIAAMVAAALRLLDAREGRPGGAIAFLVTGDEEGAAVNGTRKLLEWAAARGARFDHCVLGEPTGVAALGDTLKIGRRGSLSGILTVHGRQGHVAYPERAENPIRALLPMLGALLARLDDGTAQFQPSNLEITSIDVGNAATNVIPASASARFNVRFNDAHTPEGMRKLIATRLAGAAGDTRWDLDFVPGASAAFVTAPGPFLDLVGDAVNAVTGRRPELSTGGGTSDARFIKDYCPVVELGLVGATMHQVDEHVPLAELKALTAIYERLLEAYFG